MVQAMMITMLPLSAQTSGDRLYSQGLELQKNQTVKSQKAAIDKFKSAKRLYDSSAKKKQCDDAIAVSNNIIKSITTNKRQRVDNNNVSADLKASALEVSNELLSLNCEQGMVTVKITTTEQNWSVTPIANSNGEAFVSVKQHSDDQNFDIVCSANNSTRKRSQKLEVRAGELKKVIVVEQNGKPTILSVEETVVEFSSKGGKKSIDVYSNSDSVEEENNNRNWKVVSKPDWVNVIGEEMKKKGFLGQLYEQGKGLVKGNSSTAEDPTVVKSVMKLVVASKPKTSPSRSGEVIIASESQQATIIIQQK